ncbi:MAG: nitronate monooxygenase [Rhodospirillaceae bacterium]|jgi:enoyl-[acyl-carrier protein] reductase II|nr:nitronate monooxygenase [Rhodospirillaceae bacterium]
MSVFKTPVCDLVKIDYPVFQAGMGWIARADLAAAVSEAGGLGCVGAGSSMDADELRDEIRRVKAQTNRPFGVDILFATVAPKVNESVRYTDKVAAMVDVVFEEEVPVLVSGLGSPKGVVPEAKKRGVVVMSVVGAVRHAQKAVADGVDVIIATGSDGGGHVGVIGTSALIPAVVDAVDVPVLAGGGLADGRGLVAAMAFGAQGVWMGTRFIASKEARAHDNYKNKIVETDTAGTLVTRAHSGKTCRLIRNAFTESWSGREAEIEPYPLQAMNVGHPASLRGRIEGDVENGVLPAGQSSGLIHDVPSADEIVRSVMDEAKSALSKLT